MGLSSCLPASRLSRSLSIQLANRRGYEKSPGEHELLHFFSYCIMLLFRPFFFFSPPPPMTSRLSSRKAAAKRALWGRGLGKRGGNWTHGAKGTHACHHLLWSGLS